MDQVANRRASSIVLGALYVYFVSWLFAEITDSSLLLAGMAVSAGATIEMLIICELSQRLYLSEKRAKRFGLGTMLLVMVGLSIYLAAFGCFVKSLRMELSELPLGAVLVLFGLAFLFMAISTIALTSFAEALVSIGIVIVSRFWNQKNK